MSYAQDASFGDLETLFGTSSSARLKGKWVNTEGYIIKANGNEASEKIHYSKLFGEITFMDDEQATIEVTSSVNGEKVKKVQDIFYETNKDYIILKQNYLPKSSKDCSIFRIYELENDKMIWQVASFEHGKFIIANFVFKKLY